MGIPKVTCLQCLGAVSCGLGLRSSVVLAELWAGMIFCRRSSCVVVPLWEDVLIEYLTSSNVHIASYAPTLHLSLALSTSAFPLHQVRLVLPVGALADCVGSILVRYTTVAVVSSRTQGPCCF